MNALTIPQNLVEQLVKGNCVLFVGAGISMGQGSFLNTKGTRSTKSTKGRKARKEKNR